MSTRRTLILLHLLLLLLHAPAAPPCTAAPLHPAAAPPAGSDGGICATLVAPRGYGCRELEVTTPDGFVLSLQRIQGGRPGAGGGFEAGETDTAPPPVILQHGVLVDGRTWLLNPSEQNLPFILADSGFDVWISNARGTTFSRKHLTLDPKSPEFWNWSWDEMATYDLPAVFGFVFNQTHRKIHYVGHSQGTLTMLAALSMGKVVEQQLLRSAVLLSPVAFLNHMTTPLGVAAAKSLVGEITRLLGFAEFNPRGKAVDEFLQPFCMNPGVDCYDLLTALTGKNCCLNSSTVSLFLKNEPQSTSTRNMVHLAQIVKQRVLTKYNFVNPVVNLVRYGSVFPPAYDLGRIPAGVPLLLSYGGRDSLADPVDVQRLVGVLRRQEVRTLFVKEYAHADFILGVNARDVVYRPIVSFLRQHH